MNLLIRLLINAAALWAAAQYIDGIRYTGSATGLLGLSLVFGVVNKIFLSYEAPFLNPEISEIIVLWNKIDESATPMAERWFRKIYSFCKGDISHPESLKDRLTRFFFIEVCNIILVFSL